MENCDLTCSGADKYVGGGSQWRKKTLCKYHLKTPFLYSAVFDKSVDCNNSYFYKKYILKEIREHNGSQAELDEIAKLIRSKLGQMRELITELSKAHMVCFYFKLTVFVFLSLRF